MWRAQPLPNSHILTVSPEGQENVVVSLDHRLSDVVGGRMRGGWADDIH